MRIHHVGDGAHGIERETEASAEKLPEAFAHDEPDDPPVVVDDGEPGSRGLLAKSLLEMRCEQLRKDARMVGRDGADVERSNRLEPGTAIFACNVREKHPELRFG